MSDDTYPRVVAHVSFEGDEWPWQTAVDGTHKVVPADAIVIERGDLPEAYYSFPMKRVEAGGNWAFEADDPGMFYRNALGYLALAEYLRTHPPVDEDEVERLAGVIAEIVRPGDKPGDGTQVEINSATLARRLYLAGVRAPEVTE